MNKTEFWKLAAAGLIGAVCTVAVSWLTALPLVAGNSLQRVIAKSALAETRVVMNPGHKALGSLEQYFASCATPEQKLIGGYCEVGTGSNGDWALFNAGLIKAPSGEAESYHCSWHRETATGTLNGQIFAACLEIR